MRRALVLVAVVAFALGGLAAPGRAIAQEATPAALPAAGSELDLAAMPLTPGDLEALGFPGYGRFFNGFYASLDFVVEGESGFLGVPPEQTRALYEEVGFRRHYGTNMGLPSVSGDHESPALGGVYTNILEMADASGADAYFAFQGTPGPESDWEIVSAEAPFALGDRAEVVHSTTFDEESGEGSDELVVVFQLGNLFVTTGFWTLVPETGGTPEASPAAAGPGMAAAAATMAELEALGRAQAARVEAVLAGGAPHLPDLLLRVGADPLAATADYAEGYRLLDGEVPPYYGGRDDDLSGDPAATAGMAAAYELEEYFQVGEEEGPDDRYLVNRLYRFPDAAAATAFLGGRAEALATGGAKLATGAGPATTEDPLPGEATDLGDESLAFSFVRDFEGTQYAGYEVFVRVGAMVAAVSVEGPADLPLDLVAEIAAAQAACLAAGACPDALPVPDSFVTPLESAPAAATPGA